MSANKLKMGRADFVTRYDILADNVEEISKNVSATGSFNVTLRQLHSKVELLLLDIEEDRITGLNKDVNEDFLTLMNSKFDALKNRLNLVPIERKAHWWKWLDIMFRTVGEYEVHSI